MHFESAGKYHKEISHVCVVFNVPDAQLHGDVETVQEIAPKHKRIHGRVHTVYPTCQNTAREYWANGQCDRLWGRVQNM